MVAQRGLTGLKYSTPPAPPRAEMMGQWSEDKRKEGMLFHGE